MILKSKSKSSSSFSNNLQRVSYKVLTAQGNIYSMSFEADLRFKF